MHYEIDLMKTRSEIRQCNIKPQNFEIVHEDFEKAGCVYLVKCLMIN